jgi:dienelactone hydrolase
MNVRRPGPVLLATVTMSVAAMPPGAEDRYQAQADRARELLRLLIDEKYEEFVEASDETMKAVQPADKLKEVWTGVVASVGPYEKEIQAAAVPVGALVAVDLVCKFTSGALNVRIVLDKEGRVSGLWFTPWSQSVPYQPPGYVDTSKFREEEVTVSPGALPLPGTLTLPNGKGPFPAVVLVHGSGPHDRDGTLFKNKPLKDIAWGLASRGIAVLRYEKRTHKYGSSMDPRKITIDEETVDDAVSGARLLMTREEIDPHGVFVVGHSLGATAAPYIATKEPQIAGLIMLAAAARPLYELAEEQMVYLAGLEGELGEKSRERLEEVRRNVKVLREGTWKPGDMLLGAPVEYWASLNKMKPVMNAKSLAIPILIAQGGRDYQVNCQRDFGLWKKELAGRKNVTFRLFEKMDHLFHTGEGPSTPQQYKRRAYVDKSVIEYLADWIHAVK